LQLTTLEVATDKFGVGGNNGSPDNLYFIDGINGEMDGLFGAISPKETPKPDCRLKA
jgi:hypothetical protein